MDTSSSTSVVPADIRDWLATPAPFNAEKYGKRALFSVSNSVVKRLKAEDTYGGCVVYTREPLSFGQVWQTTVLNTTRIIWSGGLVSGCVLCCL